MAFEILKSQDFDTLENKASKVSNLKCGWSGIKEFLTPFETGPGRTNSPDEKPTVVFSPHIVPNEKSTNHMIGYHLCQDKNQSKLCLLKLQLCLARTSRNSSCQPNLSYFSDQYLLSFLFICLLHFLIRKIFWLQLKRFNLTSNIWKQVRERTTKTTGEQPRSQALSTIFLCPTEKEPGNQVAGKARYLTSIWKGIEWFGSAQFY